MNLHHRFAIAGCVLGLLPVWAWASRQPEISRVIDLRAGAARVDVTPPLGGSMYGYGARGSAVSVDVHDPLYARAAVLDDGTRRLAIVTLDLGSIRKENTERVRRLVSERLGTEAPEPILLVASHTHSAPRFDEAFEGEDGRPWLRSLEENIGEAIVAATRDLRSARLAVASGTAQECHNRRLVHRDGADVRVEMMWANREGVPTEPVDPTLTVVALDAVDESGESAGPIATLVHYACHPVVLGPENLEISADWPGAMAATVDRAIGGQTMFLQGAAGDLNPYWDKTAPAAGGFEQVEAMGTRIGLEALRVRGRLEPVLRRASETGESATIATHVVHVPMEPRWDLESSAVLEAFESRGAGALLDYYRARLEREGEAEVAVVRIDDVLALATIPGEPFVEHGMRLRRDALTDFALLLGYTNGELGYFPTLRAAAEGGYGASEATLVELGAGEELVERALVELYRMSGRLSPAPDL